MSKICNISNARRYCTFHVVFWITFFAFPFFMASANNLSLDMERYIRLLPDMMLCPLVFYLNYFYLIDKLLFHKKILLFILINLTLVVACVALMANIHYFTHPYSLSIARGYMGETPPQDFLQNRLLKILLHQGTSIVFFIALSVAIKMTSNSFVKDVTIKNYEMEKKEAELASLKSQLNPHFLFNTLNTIYVLASIDGDKAQYAVHHLSDMLRYVLYESNHEYIPLSKEIDFVQSYTELMKIRFQGRVDITEHYCSEDTGILIAPMVFITLVENAFKHGIDAIEPSFVNIDIDVRDRSVTCRVENSNYPKAATDHSGSGIGLLNLKKRLEFLYEGRYSLVTDIIGNKYVAELIIHT